MKITETNLKFKSNMSPRKLTQRIIIHHSASLGNEDAKTIHGWHLNNGWSGIGYHYIIMKSGEIQRGRPEHFTGAHAGPTGNPNSIGVCLIGHFEQHKPTDAQMKSLVWLIRDLSERYGSLGIIGHKDVMATACPGKLFPWDELKQMLAGQAVSNVRLTVNGKPTDVPLRIANGRIEAKISGAWILARDAANLLDGVIEWDEKTKTANIVIG